MKLRARDFFVFSRCDRLLGRTFTLFAVLFTSAALAYGQAEIVSPAPGGNLGSSTVTFTWTDESTNYILFVGTTGINSSNVHNSGKISTTSRQVSGVPTNAVVYVRLLTESSPGSNQYTARDYTYNGDLDDDGILDTIDPNPGSPNPKITKAGADYTFVVLGSGRVASLQIPPTLFDDLANGMEFGQVSDLTKKVYAQFQDAFDFVLFTSDQASPPPGTPYVGSYFSVKNDTQGIGTSLFNNTAGFGSAGRLQGAMHLVSDSGLRSGPSLHELMHRWGAFLKDFPSVFGGHWGYSSVGGQLGGWKTGSRESLGGNQHRVRSPITGNYGSFGPFANGGNSLPYSDLELYLMGLIPLSGQPDIEIANDFQPVDNLANGVFTASSISTYSINTLLTKNGARNPDHTTSQKNFNVAHVILVKQPLTNSAWMRYDRDVELFSRTASDNDGGYNFWEATGGRASLAMSGLLNALATPTPAPTATPTATPPPATPTPTATPIEPTPTPDPTATPVPTPAPRAVLANISTRLRVETGDNVLIGGFIVTGAEPKKVIVRAIGPSAGLEGSLADPQLEIFNAAGDSVAFNNNWRDDDGNRQAVADSGIPPANDLEAALVQTLDPGAYTAVVSGVGGATGIAVVEAYDLDRAANSKLANIATRGLVQTGTEVMIGGLIVLGDGSQKVIVRAIGPSLAVDGRLADPALQLVNASGDVLAENDNWRSHQEADIIATTIPPLHDLESAIVTTLPAAPYTAIVSGVSGATGVGVVEVYALP